MWTVVRPLVCRFYHAAASVARRNGVLGSGAALVVSSQGLQQLRPAMAVPLVYTPLKDYEVVGLQQLS